jgi:hypothetical protein
MYPRVKSKQTVTAMITGTVLYEQIRTISVYHFLLTMLGLRGVVDE